MTAPSDDRIDKAHSVLDQMENAATGLLSTLGDLRAVLEEMKVNEEADDDRTDAR